DAVVGVRMEFLALAIMPDFFGLVLPLDIHGASAPIVFFARDVVAALQEENSLAGRRQLPGECPAASARTDDDHVIMPFIVHEVLRSYSGKYNAVCCCGGIWRRRRGAHRTSDGRLGRRKALREWARRSTPTWPSRCRPKMPSPKCGPDSYSCR